jgi:hypothetical protein
VRLKNDVLVFSEVKQEVCCNLVRLKEFKLVLIGEVIGCIGFLVRLSNDLLDFGEVKQ